ncbi:MAG TPA: T9SS type A sorting domain-containing protein [Puia sp.]|nr:T9SS type A sorting domain-containing protein [Puia sp.]
MKKILPLLFAPIFLILNHKATAQGGALALNGSVNGNMTSATPDAWTISIPADGFLQLKLTAAGTADLLIYFQDQNGATIIGAPGEAYGAQAGTINADGLTPGTYHIQIKPYAINSFGAYTLSDVFTPAALANDAEPNGIPATALNLPLSTDKTGHVGYYGNNLRDTTDWYKVTINGDGLLQVNLSVSRGSAISTTTTNPLDVNITLYDHDAVTQLGSVEVFNGYGPATNFIRTDGLAAGTYYIKIQPFSTAQFANYTINSTFTPAILTTDPEPDGAAATAINLPLNTSTTGHLGYYYNHQRDSADWYKVTTTGDGLLRVYLSTVRGGTLSTNTLDVNVTLYDNNATTQLGSVEVFNGNGPATSLITTDGLAPGTYYIKVQPFSTAQFANYTITDSLFTPKLAADAEPNGNKATAINLPVNTSATGHLGYYYNNRRDTADWYKVTTTADGLLRVYLTTARGSVYSNNTLDVSIWLYDNDGTTQLGSVEVFNGNGPATSLTTTDGLAPGTYYIKVQPFSTAQFATYTITDSLFTPALAPDTEPNGSAATAQNLPPNTKTTGHVGYYYNHVRDSADWYKVTTTGPGLFKAFLTTARGSVYSNNTLDVNLWLFAANGATQLGSREVFNGNGPATDSISLNNLAAGTYYLKVQPFSTAQFADYTLTDSSYAPAAKLLVTSTVTNATCNGLTGSVSFTVSGGTAPYTYYLTNSTSGTTQHNSTGVFTSLPAGTYRDSVVDASKQFSAANITITQPAPLTVAPIMAPGGTSVAIGKTIHLTDNTPGGIWTSNSTNASIDPSTGIVTGITSGTATIIYTLTTGGCTAYTTTVVSVFGHPSATITAGKILCHGGQTTIMVNVTGGSGSYRYSLNGMPFQTSNSFSVSTGIYVVFVKDDLSGQFAVAVTIVDQPFRLSLKVVDRADATYGHANGSFTVTGTGGTAPYQYSIDNGSSYQPSGTFGNLSPGTYQVSVKDDHGCIALDQTTINIQNRGPKGGNDDNSVRATVWPNPSTTFFTLSLSSSTEQPVEIQVFNLFGHIVWQTKGEAPHTYQFGQNFPCGLYLVKIMTKEGTQTLKLIKD